MLRESMEKTGGDPRLAVVVITYHREAEVLGTLERLTGLPERPRIVVVDHGTTDATARSVAARFPSVEVLRPGRNLGASGRTLGVAHVDAPYVAFCDDDTWWEHGSLRAAADLLDAHPRVAVLTGRVLVGPEEVEDPACTEMALSPLPAEPGLPGRPILGFLAGASVVRRSAFLEAGGFEPRLFIGGEEDWLAIELASRGWSLAYVPELVVHHAPSELRDSPRRRRHLIRNALWLAWRRRPWRVALRQTLRAAGSIPRDRAMVRAFAAAISGLPWVLWERRVAPPDVEQRLRLLDTMKAARPSGPS